MASKKIKYTFWILFFLFVFSMIPAVYIARFNHMTYDDFAFGLFTHRAWVQTHSFLAVIKEAAEYTKWVYYHWQGTYSSVFFMCLQPGIFTEKAYFLTTFLMTGSLIFSVFFLIFVLNKYLIHGEKYAAGILAVVILFFCIQRIKTPVDSFYWYNGSLHYTFFQSIALILVGLEICLLYEKRVHKRILWMIISVLLSVLCGGSNYLTAFSVVLLTGTILFISFIKKRRILWEHILLTVLQTICLFFNIFAVGNRNRMNIYQADFGFLRTIYASFSKTFYDIGRWLDLTVLLGVLFLIPIFLYMFKDSLFSFFYPGLVVLGSLCLLSAMRAPTYYAMGNEGPDRATNIVQIMFYIYFFLDCGYIVGWIEKRFLKVRREALFSAGSYIKYLLCVTGIGFFLIFCDDYNNYTSLSAAASLYYNEAQLYHVKCREREALLQDSETDGEVLELEIYTIRPKVLFHSDISSDFSDSANTAMADYYDKAAIIGF